MRNRFWVVSQRFEHLTKNNMRMLRDFKALSFQSCTNVSFLHNVSTYHKCPQLSHIVCYRYFYLNSNILSPHKSSCLSITIELNILRAVNVSILSYFSKLPILLVDNIL